MSRDRIALELQAFNWFAGKPVEHQPQKKKKPVPQKKKPVQRAIPLPTDPHLTVNEVALWLGISRWSVIRRFAKFPGVIDHGHEEQLHRRRRRDLRIPKSVVLKYIETRKVKK